jgi:hypothetical protein
MFHVICFLRVLWLKSCTLFSFPHPCYMPCHLVLLVLIILIIIIIIIIIIIGLG